MPNFSEIYGAMDFQGIAESIASNRSAAGVESILEREAEELTLEDFATLISPGAADYLEALAHRAREITRRRFGNTMQIYAPMYLSNECHSTCTYCGFSFGNKDIRRLTLTPEKARTEAELLHAQGIRHVLLLTGEHYRATPVEYLGEVCSRLNDLFPSISIEVYPLEEADYEKLRVTGVDGLAVYQETYDPVRYREVHIGGVKKRLEFRLDCPDRAGRAGIRKIAIGALLGLSHPAAEVYFLAAHARWLMKYYWRTQISISLPRLRPAEGFESVPELSDRRFVQYLCALRVFLPDAGLILSTRESPLLRDNLSDICITTMSAGSRTDPGGYSDSGAAEQFSIEDTRSVDEIKSMLEAKGLEPLFTDWTRVMK